MRNHITNILPAERHQMWFKPQRDDSLKQVPLSPTTVPYYYQAAVYTSFQLHQNLQANTTKTERNWVWWPNSQLKLLDN